MGYIDKRKIVHIDMDYFYAQVEERDNPSLLEHPVIIGGPTPSRGVVCTSNYVARKYGVFAGQSTYEAYKRCPDLILIHPNFDKYKQLSADIQNIFNNYTDKIQVVGLDEAYLDLTESKLHSGSATHIAENIVSEIFENFHLTSSAGVSFNKLVAKIASDWNKPRGLCIVKPSQRIEFMKGIPLRKIPGVGPSSQQLLESIGLVTAGDVMLSTVDILSSILGPRKATKIFQSCHGINYDPVQALKYRQTFTCETTYYELITPTSLDSELQALRSRFDHKFAALEDVHFEDRVISGFTIKVRDEYFHTRTKNVGISKVDSKAISSSRSLPDTAYQDLFNAFHAQIESEMKIRLLGIGVRFAEANESQIEMNFSYV